MWKFVSDLFQSGMFMSSNNTDNKGKTEHENEHENKIAPVPAPHALSTTNPIVEFVTIDGNIGSGKSTLMKSLRDRYASNPFVIFVDEPVSDWDNVVDENGTTMLALFYANTKKHAFEFQMMAFISRLARFRQAYQRINGNVIWSTFVSNYHNTQETPEQIVCPQKFIIISERSLCTDRYIFAQMLRDSGDITLEQFTVYNKWFNEFAHEYSISKMITIKTDYSVCNDRVISRNRAGEQISLEYLQNCQKYHDKMYELLSKKYKINRLDLSNDCAQSAEKNPDCSAENADKVKLHFEALVEKVHVFLFGDDQSSQ